jgi:ferredoxin
MGIILIIGIILFSKLFCSFICPIGTVSEWLGKLGDKLTVRITIEGITDKVLRSLKYILLFITVFYTLRSNELFCKEYDPYYALTTGFGHDVVILYAALAIGIVILGSVFIRLFWCKYLCPLGAISNIFKFTGFFLVVLAVYLILIEFGVNISYVWPLAVVSIGGYLIEISGWHFRFFPVARIVRSDDACTNCQLCTVKCPQGIDVANLSEIHDADCNLCGDCLSACPEEGALRINKKKNLRWLPPAATIVLVLLGLYLGSRIEVPTIDQKWFGKTEMANAKIFTLSGLKNIKCYGSSMAFASKMKKVKGVMGVATFVGSHKVKIYYNPKILNKNKIQEGLFTPEKTALRSLPKSVDSVKVVTVGLDNFFDPYDFGYLSVLLKQKTKAVGMETKYSCPVIVKIFFPGYVNINTKKLSDILESKYLNYSSGGKPKQARLNYKVASMALSTISQARYSALLFSSYKVFFNNYKIYDKDVISVFRQPLGANSSSRRRLPYLASHLSNNKGIVGIKTFLDNKSDVLMDIIFVDTMTTSSRIYQLLNSDTLHISYKGGKKGKVANMYHFTEKGSVISKE